jgi:beta-glucosidase
MDAGHHLLLAHGLAVPRIRAHISSQAQVGITLNFNPNYAADDRPETQRDLALSDAFGLGWFLDPLFRGKYPDGLFTNMQLAEPPIQEGDFATISTPIDFLGVNNYSRNLVRGAATQPLPDRCELVSPVPGASYTDSAWEIYPNGLRDLLVSIHQKYAPAKLYVTENGAAFQDDWNGGSSVSDPRRVDFLRQYIQGVGEAVEQGVPLHGYFVWSLVDNFEWAEGYAKRFGIVYVDYPTQRRVIKESGYWYASLLAAHREAHQS